MADEAKKATPAAYLPFKTFISSIEALEHGLPKKLDRTVWRSQSGIVQGQIMMALRFFSLIDDEDQPTKLLHELVEKRDLRPRIVGDMVQSSYASILALDLTKMTPKMLEDAMNNYSVQGDTRRKAIAFFLRAVKYAELPMHPLLSAQTRNSTNGFRKKRKPKDTSGTDGIVLPPSPPPSDGSQVSKAVTLPSGTTISLNIVAKWLDMSPEERAYVFGLVDQLQNVPKSDDEEEEDE
jgi:Family of unknown function (DUF5343)